MLNTNFVKKVSEDVVVNEVSFNGFELVVAHELYTMQVEDYDAQIKSLNGKIANKPNSKGVYPYTDEEVEGFKAQREKLQGLRDADEDLRKDFEPYKSDIINEMVSLGNRENSIINLARITACVENSKLYKYAIVDAIHDEDLFDALEICHEIKNTQDNLHGAQSMTKVVKSAYKQAEDSISRFFREALSITVDNPYTDKTMIRLNSIDLRAIHELYVKGMANKTKVEEDGSITFEGRQMKTAITKTKKKDGTYTLNFSKFATDIAQIVVAKIAK